MSRSFVLSTWLIFFLLSAALPALAASAPAVTPQQTLREIAHGNGVRGGDLAEALGLERSVDKGRTVAELGLEPTRVTAVVARLRGRADKEPASAKGSAARARADTGMSIRQLAHANDLNGLALTHALGLSLSVDKDTPVREFGISEVTLRDALLHLKAEADSSFSFLKYWLWPPLLLFALWWLARGGKGRRYPRAVHLATLVLVAAVFGFALGKAPNPMEGLVKVFKAGAGIYHDFGVKVALLGYFSFLAVVGNKLICGWGCPFGALQELFYSLPGLSRLKRRKLPFAWSNGIRSLLFLLFVLVLFGWIGGRRGMVLYHYLNPFNLFGFELALWTVATSVVLFLLLSLVLYRPFCQLVCPFGWWSWLLERFSLFGIRIDANRCNDCGACDRACPLPAAAGRVAGAAMPADCFSCGRCLRVCPTQAITYARRNPPRDPAR
jgi:ferredoxin